MLCFISVSSSPVVANEMMLKILMHSTLLPLVCRCHSCFHRRKHLPMHFVAQYSAAKAFSSNCPEETSLCSEEIQKDKFLIDCGADQECVIGR